MCIWLDGDGGRHTGLVGDFCRRRGGCCVCGGFRRYGLPGLEVSRVGVDCLLMNTGCSAKVVKNSDIRERRC